MDAMLNVETFAWECLLFFRNTGMSGRAAQGKRVAAGQGVRLVGMELACLPSCCGELL